MMIATCTCIRAIYSTIIKKKSQTDLIRSNTDFFAKGKFQNIVSKVNVNLARYWHCRHIWFDVIQWGFLCSILFHLLIKRKSFTDHWWNYHCNFIPIWKFAPPPPKKNKNNNKNLQFLKRFLFHLHEYSSTGSIRQWIKLVSPYKTIGKSQMFRVSLGEWCLIYLVL